MSLGPGVSGRPARDAVTLCALAVLTEVALAVFLCSAVVFGGALALLGDPDYEHPLVYAADMLVWAGVVALGLALLSSDHPGREVIDMSGAYGPERVPENPPPAEPAPAK